MSYGQPITLTVGYDEAVDKVKQAFQEQGFGTLSEIDVRATLKEKIGADIEHYVILGVCNPQLAQQALDTDRSIGLLLPCNVVVREDSAGTRVEVLDPGVMVTVTGLPELQPLADEAQRRISAALEALQA